MIVTATYLDLVHLYQDWSVSFAFCGGRFLVLFFSSRKLWLKKNNIQLCLLIDKKHFRVKKHHIPLFKDRL